MASTPDSAATPRGPLRDGLMTGFAVFAATLVSVVYLDYQAERNQTDAIREDLSRLARGAAGLVDGDLHESVVKAGMHDSADYKRALEPLVVFHRGIPEIAYLYTFIERDGGFLFGLDTATAADRLGFNRPMQASPLLTPYESKSPEEDAAEMEALRKGVVYVSGQPYTDEYGSFLTGVAPIRNAQGKVVGIVGVDLNVSDYLKRMKGVRVAGGLSLLVAIGMGSLLGFVVWSIRHKSMRHEKEKETAFSEKSQLEDRDRQLIKALGQIVYRHRLDIDHIHWTGDVEKIVGYTAADLPRDSKRWLEHIHPDDRSKVDAVFEKMLKERVAFLSEYRFRRKDGGYTWVEDRGVISEAEGSTQYVDGVLVYISARKASEIELILARDTAESAGRAKGEFLAVMSHEIRTPMNGVIGYTNLLKETALNSDQREYLESLEFCSKSLLDLLNDILDFSKMDSGKMELENHPFSLRKSMEEVTSHYAHLASQKNIELTCEFTPGAPEWILGDSSRLRQIMVNLIGNALKFTEHGSVTVKVDGDDKTLRIAVQDTGIGIPVDKIDRLFKAFSQADSSTTRRFGGTGLGLAICAKLVETMGGKLQVESEAGAGSRFFLEVPYTVPTKEQIFESLQTAESGEAVHGEVPSMNILVAEDNPVNRKLVSRILNDLGHTTEMVANGREGLDAVLAGDYDMIFTDLQMPELDGYEMTRLLREQKNSIWITALTAEAMPDDAAKCLRAGMNDYVSKPFTKETIRTSIERCYRTIERLG